MRALLLAPALFFALHAAAQCCCADQIVEVRATEPMHSDGKWHFTVRLNADRHDYWSMDSVPGDPYTVRLRMPTGCGIEHATWNLQHERSGQHMQVHLYHLPGDFHLPELRLPWTASRSLHFDLNDVLGCAAVQGSMGDKVLQKDLSCRTGRMRCTFNEGRMVRFEPLELEPWTIGPSSTTAYGASQEARFIGGADGMQHYLQQQVDPALIESLPGQVTFTGRAMVEVNGSVYELIIERTPYPALEEAIRTALLGSDRWQPAVVERPGDRGNTVDFQAIRHTVPVRFVADPTTIWKTISEYELSVLPLEPTTRDSLQLHFQWYAGSCGRYRDSVVISPPTAQRPWTDIAVGIGLVGNDCDDVAIRHWTVVLPPQPAGRLRVRYGAVPEGTSPYHERAPYNYREVLVR